MLPPTRPFLCVLLAAGCVSAAQAQTSPPTAGELLRNNLPAPAVPPAPGDDAALPAAPSERAAAPQPDEGPRIALRALRITGASAFPEAELQALVAEAPGRSLTLAELRGLAARITRHYREHGYLLARAYLPAQEIQDGRVEIAVLEGRLGERRLHNRSSLDDARVAERLSGVAPGEPLRAAPLERALLLLDELPGLSVQSTLTPGASVGTSDLDIRIEPGSGVEGEIGFDNFGNRHTGRARVLAGLAVHNPLRLADRLALRAVSGGEGFNYARLAWQAPLGASDWQLGASVSAMHYALGGDFEALDASGDAYVAGLYALYPLQRSRAARLDLQLALDHKQLDDDTESVGLSSRRRIDSLALGLSGHRRDSLGGGGLTQGWLRLTRGDLSLDPVSAALDTAGLRTAGRYGVLGWQLQREQRLVGPFSLLAGWSGQATRDNLDASEKLSLGGPGGVRAYPQGEAPSDQAWLGRVELRWSPQPAWQLALFHDAAHGRLNRRPLAAAAGANERHLRGSGLGLQWSPAARVSLAASVAWRDGAAPTADRDRSPRLWVQGSCAF